MKAWEDRCGQEGSELRTNRSLTLVFKYRSHAISGMTRWKKDSMEFIVSIHKRTNRGGSPDRTCNLPRPVADALGDPDRLKFVMVDGQVIVEASEE